jgi:cobalt-zinc-cadmium efflux system outer membrane protein
MELPPFATLVGRLDGSLDGAKWKAELSSHTANVAVEEARSRPDLTVSGGLRHFQDEGKVAAVVGASVSLPVFDRNTGGIREAEERLRGAASNADTSRLKAANELSLAYEHLSSLHREAKAIAQTLLPKARSVYDTLERAYRHGASTYVELSAAQKTMLELATRRIEVESAFLTSLIEVERLTAPAAAGR